MLNAHTVTYYCLRYVNFKYLLVQHLPIRILTSAYIDDCWKIAILCVHAYMNNWAYSKKGVVLRAFVTSLVYRFL